MKPRQAEGDDVLIAQLVWEWKRVHKEPSGIGTAGPRITPTLRSLLDRLAGLRETT